ncbi:DNA gyrase subunit A [Clavibacter michiganensis subsp. michiganensis]|uniref:DNA topoisomerase (ATP-hydrolyzing) n=1 Tax=Clavibacter michiganensis subsp. michiganensis TaxID=33013 RepID=A0A251XEH0_CLAMM|nr:DNA gyrase subunit A [Clavibacter michiganensis subsp. michiganensis]OUE00774.1 DNA gyrase subunit A [Clavibacter michiganensis subsp. michiganensis]
MIEIKTGFNPEAVLEQLYRYTPLEDGFSINNVALVDGSPQTLGLKELLQVYVAHRLEVVTRRTRYRLARQQERLHLVLGLLIAILDIDEVIQVIRGSDDTEQARARLMDVFDLSTLQADYILELRLRRLTRFSRIELEEERDRLQAEIAELEAILADPRRLRALVSTELQEVADRFGTPRRTLLTEAAPSVAGASSRRAAPCSRSRTCPAGCSCRRRVAPCASTCRRTRRARPCRRSAAVPTTPSSRPSRPRAARASARSRTPAGSSR